MSIESIIGIISGLLAIGGAIIGLYKRFKRKSLTELMNQLVDKKRPTKAHKKFSRR